jgi:hypothetical protein
LKNTGPLKNYKRRRASRPELVGRSKLEMQTSSARITFEDQLCSYNTSFAISGDVMTTCLTEPTWIENMGPYFAAQVVKLRCGFFSVSCKRLPNNGSPGIATNPNPLSREKKTKSPLGTLKKQ